MTIITECDRCGYKVLHNVGMWIWLMAKLKIAHIHSYCNKCCEERLSTGLSCDTKECEMDEEKK